MSAPFHLNRFEDRRALALQLLELNVRMTRKSGSFCGQLAVDQTPLSEAQQGWLVTLAERAGLSVEV